jgi:hypothetical protein
LLKSAPQGFEQLIGGGNHERYQLRICSHS